MWLREGGKEGGREGEREGGGREEGREGGREGGEEGEFRSIKAVSPQCSTSPLSRGCRF